MELPATVLFALIYFNGEASRQWVPLVFLAMWQAHYLHRTFVFPFRTRTGGKRIPLLIVGSGFLFNLINAYINARFVSSMGEYSTEWLSDPRFLAGLAIFLAGMTLNIRSDNALLKLRSTGKHRLRDPPRRRIPLRVVPQLPRRNHRMGRLGAGHLVPRRLRLLPLHRRQPGPQGPQPPQVVPRALPRLSPQPKGPDTRRPLTCIRETREPRRRVHEATGNRFRNESVRH